MDIPPNQTLYLSNLHDKLTKEEEKRCLYALFGQFGKVVDVVIMKTGRLRGQAWLVFSDVTCATNALRSMQDFPFFGKPMKLDYAKTKSDAVAKQDGTWHRDKRTRKVGMQLGAADARKSDAANPEKKFAAPSGGPTQVGKPNNILFVENLPEATNEAMLGVLFKQFPGFYEARLVPGKPGISFIEFETEVQAGVALSGLQAFKITPQHAMRIIYAKQ